MKKLFKLITSVLILFAYIVNHLYFPSDSNILSSKPEYAYAQNTLVKTSSNVTDRIHIYSVNKTSNTLPLIVDSKKVDYMSYIPDLTYSDNLKTVLDITNPDISIDASSAILFNAKDGKVLFHKDPVRAVFPSSTAKLLSALVALEWCKTKEEVKVGDEINLIPEDSSKANLIKGQIITVYSLLNAMLLPSGNDAAYVMAVHVGRKSLNNKTASKMKAIKEFVRLMNAKALELGAENSCFITPDGYDAIGQYTTAYDMGLIGLAAVKSNTLQSITKRSRVTAHLITGEKFIWKNTNSLIDKNSSWYRSNVIGLKTGTTTMAGRCLISAAQNEKGTVVCVVMNSTIEGRWKDSVKLLEYGLNQLN